MGFTNFVGDVTSNEATCAQDLRTEVRQPKLAGPFDDKLNFVDKRENLHSTLM